MAILTLKWCLRNEALFQWRNSEKALTMIHEEGQRLRKDKDRQSKGSIPHNIIEKRVEVHGIRQTLENPSVQHNINVQYPLLYGADIWRMNKTTLKRIQTYVNQCLRNSLGIQWMDKVSSKNLWEKNQSSSTRYRHS